MDQVACDVLVVGSGAGGFATAITAAHHGLDVLMVEKEAVFGGTTALSAGVVWIPGNADAAAQGFADSREDALAYIRHEAGNRFDQARAEAFVDNGARMLAFFEQHTLVRYKAQAVWADYHPDAPGAAKGWRGLMPEPFDGRALGAAFGTLRPPLASMMVLGGMMIARDDLPQFFRMTRSASAALYCGKLIARYGIDRLSHARGTRLANGNALVARLAKSAFDAKIPLWLSSPVAELVTEAGRVSGAVISRQGKPVRVKAAKGVVLACGGFPGSAEMQGRFYAHVAAGKNHLSAAPATNTGDGIRLAQAAGAAFQDDAVQPAAWTPVSLLPQKDGSVVPFPHFIDRGKPGVIAVDRRGRRFANEARSYHDFVPRMFETCREQDTVEAWIIADHRAFRRYGLGAAPPAPHPVGRFLRSGYIASGQTVRELAARIGVDAEGLVRTVADFNAHAAAGEDPEFGKGGDAYQRFNGDLTHGPNPCLAPLEQAPFHAVRIIPGDIGTFLGLRTDAATRVLDQGGAVIPGLHAVGNDAASVMGGAYPGPGITIGPAMTFGWLAGRHLAGIAG